MKRIILFITAAALALVACKTTTAPDQETTPPPAELKMTDDGLARLVAEDVLTKAEIEATYPGYDIAGNSDDRRIAIRDGGETLVLVDLLETGYRAKVTSPRVLGPKGLRVGSGFSALLEHQGLQCRRQGENGEFGHCTIDALDNIIFVFDLEGATTGDCETDCRIADEYLAALEAKSISTIDFVP